MDLWMMVFFGVLGYVFLKIGCEAAPFILGFLLGPLLEEYFRRSMILSRGSLEIFVTKPISAGILLVVLVVLASMLFPAIRKKKETVVISDG